MKLNHGVRFDHLASVYEEYTGKIAVENLRPSWLIFSDGFRKSRCSAAAKRAIDLALSLARAAAGGAHAADSSVVAIRVDVARPGALQPAARRQGRPLFTIYKFRSMRADAEAATGAVWSTERRSARDARRPLPAAHAARRAAAAVERAARRHELRRPAARAAGVRRRADRRRFRSTASVTSSGRA